MAAPSIRPCLLPMICIFSIILGYFFNVKSWHFYETLVCLIIISIKWKIEENKDLKLEQLPAKFEKALKDVREEKEVVEKLKEVRGKVPKADAYYLDKPSNTLFYLIQKPDNASPDYCSELIYSKNLTTGVTKELFSSRNHREDRIPPKITADGEKIFVRSHKDFLVYYNVKENILRRKGVCFDIEHMQAIGNRVLVVGEKKFEVYKVKQRFEDVANYRIDSPCHLHDGVFVFSRDSYLGVTSMENDNLRFKQTNVSVSADVKITRKSNHVFELEQKGRKEDYLLEYSDGKPTLTLLDSNAVNKKPESSKSRFLHRIWQGVVIRFWVFLAGLAIKELFEVVNVPLPAAF